jgi:putative nucleotidyltransferase with HDIG domain
MIKKIPINQLAIGMYIHDLNCGWMDHPFARNRFIIDEAATLNKILGVGVEEVYIDTDRGEDVVIEEVSTYSGKEIDELLPQPSALTPGVISKLSPAGEFDHANNLYSNANKFIKNMMNDIRFGKLITLKRCEPIIEDIIDSVFRFPSALLPLAQIKARDEYTFQHSVSVAALAAAFGRVLELPRNEIRDIAMGGLLHDVGKAMMPVRMLNKPGKLDGEEFYIMKTHVLHTIKLLNDIDGISDITLNAAAQHHERYDGTGYPHGLKGDADSTGRCNTLVKPFSRCFEIQGLPGTFI